MSNQDAFLGLGMFLIGVALLIFASTLAAVVWFSIMAIIAYFRYRKYLQEGEEVADELAAETGVENPFDDMVRAAATYGFDTSEAEYDRSTDWLAGG